MIFRKSEEMMKTGKDPFLQKMHVRVKHITLPGMVTVKIIFSHYGRKGAGATSISEMAMRSKVAAAGCDRLCFHRGGNLWERDFWNPPGKPADPKGNRLESTPPKTVEKRYLSEILFTSAKGSLFGFLSKRHQTESKTNENDQKRHQPDFL